MSANFSYALPFSFFHMSTLTESVCRISIFNSLNNRIYGYNEPVPCLSYNLQSDGELAILLLFQLLSEATTRVEFTFTSSHHQPSLSLSPLSKLRYYFMGVPRKDKCDTYLVEWSIALRNF